ncbi:uncharacterized protein F4812DRAFT_467800 [Daldinia caldariorum]|uniref:uncharacterized protein n=1 Tax=Daldinia caldariorum TaxID=326644 RepID=UPI0020080869|nr:uncharacterized protein F4812DRAFT_467800 [Daldinia caldariorum]KAI1471886.1 hypothetical protein F4812DRAFT_467800 [Daldinia caldariorum]
MSSPNNQNNQKTDRVPETPGTPDSGIVITDQQGRDAMAQANETAQGVIVRVDIGGVAFEYTLKQIAEMANVLARARADGHFPPTTARGSDVRATVHDYLRFIELSATRGDAPQEAWTQMPDVVQMLVDITQEIQARDKVAADMNEQERIHAHVNNMMSGVGAEARLYNIVQHAIAHAGNNGGADRDAAIAGQNMAALLDGIRDVIREMAGQGAHGVNNGNVEAVLEEVFGTIDHALNQSLGGHVRQMDGQLNTVNGQLNTVNGQLNTVNGQIMHLDAIGQHVNAISGHVNSLGNNLGAMSTLLNSTNGNVVSLNTQIGLLQTIINMLPRMIAESLQQMLPEALQGAIGPIIQALEAQLGVPAPAGSAQNDQRQPRGLKKVFKSVKKLFRKK